MSATRSTAPITPTGGRSVASFLYRDQVPGTLAIFAFYLVGLVLLGAVANRFDALEGTFGGSLVAGSTQLVLWYTLAIGVYLTGVYLPIYIAHGRTRREILQGSLLFAAGFAVIVSLLIGLAFVLEAGAYKLLGWSGRLADPHPLGGLAAASQTLTTLVASFLVFTVVGMLCGAAFYRSIPLGLVSLVPAFLVVSTIQLITAPIRTVGGSSASSIAGIPLPDVLTDVPLGTAVGLCLLAVTATSVATWLIVRDIAVRPRST
jgi:hypothetical protein